MNMLHIECKDTRIVRGVSDNSRDIQKDWLFVLRDKAEKLGKGYAQEALAAGGVVLCDQDMSQENIYHCEHVEYCIPALMEYVYGDLCEHLCVIGVTGTSGKTSVASLIHQLLAMHEQRVMQIGTGFVKYGEQEIITHNTTPGCFQLAEYFKTAVEEQMSHVVMEVSSHAIDQDRIRYLRFDMIMYTNITQDHLDYHLTKTHYRYTKFKLRRYLKAQGAIIYNADMDYMQELMHLAHYNCISFGCEQAHFPIREVKLSDHDISFILQGYHYRADLLGMMNVYNLCEALVVMRRLKYTYEELQEDVEHLKTIAGRMEVVHAGGMHVWIDYAHTSDALKNLLEFAQMVKKGRIITIIGCGGDRDRSKRSVMADTAAQYSDIAIFTSDNPRGERVCDILQDMLVHPHENVQVFENRFFAIKHAVKIAQNSDIIIIAGKGNEDVLQIREHVYPFSDRACVYELVQKGGT